MNLALQVKLVELMAPITWILFIQLTFPARLDAQWPQWGGPNRDFKVDAQGLATSWPKSGPKRLWAHDFLKEFKATIQSCGFGASRVVYRNTESPTIGPGPFQRLWARSCTCATARTSWPSS